MLLQVEDGRKVRGDRGGGDIRGLAHHQNHESAGRLLSDNIIYYACLAADEVSLQGILLLSGKRDFYANFSWILYDLL